MTSYSSFLFYWREEGVKDVLKIMHDEKKR